jgi:hypothetical protein
MKYELQVPAIYGREALVGLATHQKEVGAGVTVTCFWKAGSVDYK